MVIETTRGRPSYGGRHPARPSAPANREWVVVASVIAAAALATFFALFLTSRPYDPMDSTLPPQQEVPASSPMLQSSPKPSPSPSATPAALTATPVEATGEAGAPLIDDAAIQAEIERRMASDPSVSGLAVSTMVEGGRITVFGTVRSPELKTRVERIMRSIKGVVAVDNQLVVTEPTP